MSENETDAEKPGIIEVPKRRPIVDVSVAALRTASRFFGMVADGLTPKTSREMREAEAALDREVMQLNGKLLTVGEVVQAVRSGIYTIEKYEDEWDTDPWDVVTVKNAYINTGSAVLLDLLAGIGGTPYSNANAYIGVGDSTAATTVTMTDLQATTNVLRVGMDATYPSRTGQKTTWKATFGSGAANYAWQEAGLFNASSGGSMLSRVAQNLGPKSGGSWAILYDITIP